MSVLQQKMMADRDVPSSSYINDLAVLAVMDTTLVVSSVVVVIYFWRSNLLLFALALSMHLCALNVDLKRRLIKFIFHLQVLEVLCMFI